MVLLFTSKESSILTDTMAEYDIHKFINEIDLNLSDRLTLQLIINIAGGGSDPTVEVQIEGNTDSRVELVVPGANVGTFVPYLGAIFNLNLGSNNFSLAQDNYIKLGAGTWTYNGTCNIIKGSAATLEIC